MRKRYRKGSAIVEEWSDNARLYISHGSYPFFTDDSDHGGVAIERADVHDMALCLLVFGSGGDSDVAALHGVTIEEFK